MKRWTRGCTVLVPLAIFASVACGDTLESVEKTIIEKGKTIKSMSWKSTYVSDNVSDSVKTRSEGKTSYEFMIKDEKKLFRVETAYTTVTETNGSKQTNKGTTLSVSDGEFQYVHGVIDGMESVMKMPATLQGVAGTEQSFFDTMARSYNLELMPDAKVGSYTTYVIRAVIKKPVPMAATEMTYYFDKATGVTVKSVSKDSDGKVTMETLTTDLKVNSSISPDRFVFTPPEGVKMTDLTQQQDYNAPQSENAEAKKSPQSSEKPKAGAEPSGEKPKEKPAKTEEKKTEKKKEEKKEKKSKWPKLPKKKWP